MNRETFRLCYEQGNFQAMLLIGKLSGYVMNRETVRLCYE